MAESEQSAVDIATAVRSGATTARTQVEAALARLEERNLEVNAFTTIRRDEAMAEAEITIRVELGHGSARDRVWTCDLTHDYVTINADYRS